MFHSLVRIIVVLVYKKVLLSESGAMICPVSDVQTGSTSRAGMTKGLEGAAVLETSDREGRDARRIPAGHHRRAAAEEKRIISVPKKAEYVQIAPCAVNKKYTVHQP